MGSKIHFSATERELMNNAEIILTKNVVLKKIRELLEEVQERQMNFTDVLPDADPIFTVSPKISRGENYLGLPYQILDYPRLFKGTDIFTIRSMFWWGNFFSSTLQLSGGSCLRFRDTVASAYQELKEEHYYIGINQDPWIHHFEKDNYKLIGELSEARFRNILSEGEQIKIAARWPLNEADAATKLFGSWMFLLKICALIP